MASNFGHRNKNTKASVTLLILKQPQALAAVELAEGLRHRGRKPTPPEEWERREAIRIKILDLNSRYNSHGLTLRKRHAYTTV